MFFLSTKCSTLVLFVLQNVRHLRLGNGRSAGEDFLLLVLWKIYFLLVGLNRTSAQSPDPVESPDTVFGAEAEVDDGVSHQGQVGGPDEEDFVFELVGKNVQLFEAHRGFNDSFKLDDVHWGSGKQFLKLSRKQISIIHILIKKTLKLKHFQNWNLCLSVL